jgi:ethanolamine utilization protein EutQ (cupin superfamily)
VSNKRDKFASILQGKMGEDVPSQDRVLDTIMNKQESQLTSFTVNKKNRVNARGRIKVTFELEEDMEFRLKKTALNSGVKVVDLVHAIFNKALEK